VYFAVGTKHNKVFPREKERGREGERDQVYLVSKSQRPQGRTGEKIGKMLDEERNRQYKENNMKKWMLVMRCGRL